MTAVTLSRPAARPVAQDWDHLAEVTNTPEVFAPTAIGDLPNAARRRLIHAIPAGTPLSYSMQLTMHRHTSVRDVKLQRWGNPAGSRFGYYPFGVTVEEAAVLGGVTIPSVIRAGWFWGTHRQYEGEFFRTTITAATFSSCR